MTIRISLKYAYNVSEGINIVFNKIGLPTGDFDAQINSLLQYN